jgi:hypothetical protein
MYYFAMVNDVVCRCLWTVSLSVGFFDMWFGDGLVAILMLAELYR